MAILRMSMTILVHRAFVNIIHSMGSIGLSYLPHLLVWQWAIYLNMIIIRTIHSPCDLRSSHLPWILTWKSTVYVKMIMVRMKHLTCNLWSSYPPYILAWRWEIYLSMTIHRMIHLPYNLRSSYPLYISAWNWAIYLNRVSLEWYTCHLIFDYIIMWEHCAWVWEYWWIEYLSILYITWRTLVYLVHRIVYLECKQHTWT